ncbi:glycoside hydrolase family 99-like domain-containing protein [Proteus vulgaris]|uniref:glycosyltransferase WbsX family protein n=1 Tax=Proteus TaxID=583 RepID=UPI001377C28A|nr:MULTISPECIES: glycoside hydrolase family 99-like domain-containing protein [Proteus]MBG5986040.1 glycoside hydrolase family 99-like domain-containing protein [Proteus vulgaris]NBN44406.1 glycosyl transferase [Proteus sp. G2626]
MKVIAYYLPQFHEIPENNEWWGKGFTEWTNVKKAKPLFKDHLQPRIPLNNNYYDLSDTKVMEKQAEMAKSYGVDAFCFYHYWFDGKLLLEKPLLNLLDNKNIKIDFCLSWANEPWARTWDGKDKDVLVAQNYGSSTDWEKHFNYLVKYFKDERYIKINGSPMLLIYKSKNIPNFDDMLLYWNDLAIKHGFEKGLHIVETMAGQQAQPISSFTKAVVEFEPSLSLGLNSDRIYWLKNKIKMLINKGLYRMDYMSLTKKSTQRNCDYGKQCYLGCFPGWDNTPRKQNRGVVFDNANPDNFYEYLVTQMKKSSIDSFLFINAWNEWAEGAYLEPDEYNGYGFLEAVKNAKNTVFGDK